MKLNWSNIFMMSLCLALAGLILTILWLNIMPRGNSQGITLNKYWIEIPDNSMDATRPEIRELIRITLQSELFHSDLFNRCGTQELYRFEFFDSKGFITSVSVNMNNNDAIININNHPSRWNANNGFVKQTTNYVTTRETLADIKFTLEKMPVWSIDGTQYPSCYGNPHLFFEACINEKYAVRNHGCNFESEAHQILESFKRHNAAIGK